MGMVLTLAVAVYLNWQFAQSAEDLELTGNLTSSADESGKNYGDAEFVNGLLDSEDYFASTRLDRQKARDEAVEVVKNIFQGTEITAEQIDAAAQTATEIAASMDQEVKIEAMIKAKGFRDCVVFIDGDKVTVVVRSDGLLSSDAAKIKDIVVGTLGTKAENINIIDVK